MSNSLAIAAVTATLQNLIFQGTREELGSGDITALPLDKARENRDRNQINLFLYHTMPSPAWSNRAKPRRVRHGETEKPPLALDLYYLITAYGESDNDPKSHALLGQVMSILHDHRELSPAEIEAATVESLSESDLHQQLERVSISPQALSFEETSKIWGSFQAQYRISVAYQVSVVLIDSTLPVIAALPVLARGRDDNGAVVFPLMTPTLQAIQLPNRKPSAQMGDVLTLVGNNLDRPDVAVRLRHSRHTDAIELQPLPGSNETELQVQLPNTTDNPQNVVQWLAGFYTLSLALHRPDYSWTTNELPLPLAPQIASITPQEAPPGDLTLTLTCTPQIRPEQRLVLLFGDRGIMPQPVSLPDDPTLPSELRFQIEAAQPGTYVLRLRVDGVDSIPVDFSARPLQFAADQQVRIMPSSSTPST